MKDLLHAASQPLTWGVGDLDVGGGVEGWGDSLASGFDPQVL